MFSLRKNQETPVQKGIEFFKSKNPKPAIIVAPTAYGKSWLIAAITKDIPGKTLILQPSKELLQQNYEKFIALDGEASIYSASFNTKEYGNNTYATIGSIKNLGKEFKARGYTNLLVDEVHLYPRSNDGMLMKFLKESGITKILGLTATPFKLQNNIDYSTGMPISQLKMLTNRNKHGTFFKDILHIAQIEEIIQEGYWSKLEYELYDFNTGKLVYNSTKAEYTEDSIRKEYESQDIEKKILSALEEKVDRKSILVFVPSVIEAQQLASKTPNSAYVCANTPKKERDEIVKLFKEQKIRVLFNVNIFSVGFDYEKIDCIIAGRPTASLAWWYQVVGRGTRISDGKINCLIVDFVGNTQKFGRVEFLYYKQQGGKWVLYGENGRRLTDIPLHEIGLHTEEKDNILTFEKEEKQAEIEANRTNNIITFGKFNGKEVKDTPDWWRKWMLKEFKFDSKTNYIKEEILKLQQNGGNPSNNGTSPNRGAD